MKFSPIIFLALITLLSAAEEQKELYCNSDLFPFATSGKDCQQRKVEADSYCCYIKGQVRESPYIKELNGCIRLYKREVDNDEINAYMRNMKNAGYDISIDCISSYLSISSLLLLFMLI